MITPQVRSEIAALSVAELIDNLAHEHVRVAKFRAPDPRDREASREFRRALMKEIDNKLNATRRA